MFADLLSMFFACLMVPWTWFNPEECVGYLNQLVELEQAYDSDWKITIDWFEYNSDANRVANFRYNNSNWDLDMIATFIAENWAFDKSKVSKTNDRWICQLHYNKTNAVWIDNPRRDDIMFQAEVCLDKWKAVPDPSKVWYGWKNRNKTKQRIRFIS